MKSRISARFAVSLGTLSLKVCWTCSTRVTLSRPEKRNAITPLMLQELHDALLEADDRTDVNAIVLEGAGRDSCAGYDLGG